MNPDLVWLKMNWAINGLIDEASRTHASNINVSVANVLNVEALYTKWQQDCTVCKVFNNHVLFVFVVTCVSHDVRITGDILYEQAINRKNFANCLLSFCWLSLRRLSLSWLSNRCLLGFSSESELFLGHSSIFLFTEGVLEGSHLSLIFTKQTGWNSVLIVSQLLTKNPTVCVNSIKVSSDLVSWGPRKWPRPSSDAT